MYKEIITFGDTEIEERKLQCYKYPIFQEDVDIDNITPIWFLLLRKIILYWLHG